MSAIGSAAASSEAAADQAAREQQQDSIKVMAEISDTMKLSFKTSLQKISKKGDPLAQRYVNKQAVTAERSNILHALAALRGQRYRVTRRFDEEEQTRLAVRECARKPDPIPSFVVDTKWGEMEAGDRVLDTGDADMWLTESLKAKESALLHMSEFCSTLTEHMPPLADIATQREQLEEERQALADELLHLKAAQRRAFQTGTLEGHAEKLMRERDTLRHSWSGGGTTINSHAWYHGDDFEQTGANQIQTPPNWPHAPHYPHPPKADVHAGENKVLARQALLRLDLSKILRDDPACKGLMPALSEIHSPRAVPHMHHVLSCVSRKDKTRMSQGSWSGMQRFLGEKSMLDPHTGKLTNSAMALGDSSVISNSHFATLDSQKWLQAQVSRSWDATSAPGPTAHAVNCCCLSCSLCLQGDFPQTRSLYHRLVTHEAGNTYSFAKVGQDVVSPRGKNAGIIRRRNEHFGAGPRHPQVPNGFKISTPRTEYVPSPRAIVSKQSPIKDVSLSQAIRGSLAHSLRFAAKVNGLVETV